MATNEEPQKYRAQVGALIVNDKDEVLIVQNVGYPSDLWDFVKGGMHENETLEESLKREISEELGAGFEYEVIAQSGWKYVYDWPLEMQKAKNMRGAARLSFWVKYIKGEIVLDPEELVQFKWIPIIELGSYLNKGSWIPGDAKQIIFDWENLKSAL